jgi:hypothetical protein
MYLQQLADNWLLVAMTVGYIISVAASYIAGLYVTKELGALARSLFKLTYSILVWVGGMTVTLTIGRADGKYRWEKTNTVSCLVQLVGFSLLAFATLLYNENIKFRWLSCEPTQEVIEMKE